MHKEDLDENAYKELTLDEFKWAWMTVCSRVFTFLDMNGEECKALVPLADMLNHSYQIKSKSNKLNFKITEHNNQLKGFSIEAG